VNYSTDERTCSLYTPPHYFVGTKPTAVTFGEKRIEVKTWRQVAGVILKRCYDERGEALMDLRNKVTGKVRMIFSDSPKGMRSPLEIIENAYLETHYGSQTLMYIVKDLILDHTGFDYSNITIAIKRK
jgi:hypothetical protein